MTTRFLTGPMHSRLKAAMRHKPVLAAVAYVTDVDGLPLGKGDLLVCDATDATARAGSTSREALRDLIARGVEVLSLPKLHAKVVVAGQRAIVGSSNWSRHSEDVLTEANLDTDDPTMVKAATAFVRRQARKALRVDGAFLDRMPEAQPATHVAGGARRHLTVTPAAAWLLTTHPLAGHEEFQERVKDSLARLEKVTGSVTLDFIRWDPGDKEGTRLRRDDRVVIIWHDDDGTVWVCPPVQILDVVEEEVDLYAIYAGASDHEERVIRWSNFKKLADKIGLPKKVNPRSSRSLKPEMVDELLRKWPRR